MTINGPDPVPDPELVLLLDGWAVSQEASNDHPERSHVNENDNDDDNDGDNDDISPVCSEGRVLGRLLIVSREDAKGGLQQLHRGHVSSETLGSHQSGNVNSLDIRKTQDIWWHT